MATLAQSITEAIAFHQAGDLAQAERCYRLVLAGDPEQVDALHYLGVLEAQRGRGAEALALIERALAREPRAAEVHFNRGNILQGLNRFAEALASYDQVLLLMPQNAPAHYNRGNVLQQLKRHEEALASYDKLLALMPDNAAAFYNRGVALQALKRYEEALASYDRALSIALDDAEVLSNRGIALYELKRYEEALASYDQALAIKPDFVEVLNNRGNVLRELNRLEEALASCDKALAIKPDYLEALTNRGMALQALNRHAEALVCYDRALAVSPNYADAHWAVSLCSLALGDFERGWREYEWRWKTEDFPSPRREFQRPLWLGREDIRGKTILLYGEQGLGDTLQFSRYVEMVAHRGANVILEVQPALKSLLAGLHGAPRILATGERLPDFEYQCPLLSLPLAFKTTLETVPARVPYIETTPERVMAWRTRLAQTIDPRDFRVGICWQGQPAAKADIGRSIPLREFYPLSQIPGVRLISLQKHHGLDQLDDLPAGMKVETLGDDFDAGSNAFVDSAAVMESLDLIVASDTSVVHLAGALARPVWVALKHVPDWRFMREQSASPWYPTVRLFRQPKPADWHAVFAIISSELQALVASR